MFPIPAGILVLHDFGESNIKDFFRGNTYGRHLVVQAKPEILINWLKNFKDIWASENMNPNEPMYIANIKDKFNESDFSRF